MSTIALSMVLACGGATENKQPPAKEAETKEPAKEAETKETKEAAPAARLSFTDALARARAKHPDAPAFEVEIEAVDGRDLLEVEFLKDGGVHEVYLDPQSGEVVKEKDETLTDEEKAALPKLGELLKGDFNIDRAITLVESKVDPKGVREIKLVVHEDKLALRVEADEGGEVKAKIYDTGFAMLAEAEVEAHDEADKDG